MLLPKSVLSFILLMTISLNANAQEAVSQDETPWMEYLESRVESLSAKTAADLAAITPENWPETQTQWRAELREMLGIPTDLKKTKLEATTVGSIELDGVSIDRLHYQSRPGLYVTANLYRPRGKASAGKQPTDGYPAVLYVCGHSRATDQGRLLGNKTGYQHHGLWLARHGVICLMIDTTQLGEFHGEHHGTYKLGRWDWISKGFTPAGVETWNAIRGIDLLTSLPEVDGSRVGITGRSGGGAYSWFTAALDERIKVAVPVAGITDLQNHVVDGCVEGHCDCMYFVNYHRWDYAKLAALVAPRALLLENSDSDRIFPLSGVLRVEQQIRQLYEQLGASNQYGLVITPGPHQDTQDLQTPAFRWLMKHLTGEEVVVDEPALKEVAPTALAVFDAESPADEKVTSVASWFAPTAEPVDTPAEAAEAYRSKWAAELVARDILPGELRPIEFKGAGSDNGDNWLFANGEDVPAINIMKIVKPGSESNPPVVHLLLDSSNDWATNGRDRIDSMPDRVHYLVRWRGHSWLNDHSSSKKQIHLARRFYLLGESLEALALHDLLLAIQWISSQSGGKIELAGAGRESVLVVLAALHANQSGLADVETIVLGDYPTDPILAASLPGLLQICDLASLRAAASELLTIKSADIRPLSGPLLIDTASEPQQANGIRIVEVSDTTANLWARATRWPLANLADLPEVQFTVEKGKQSSGAVLPEAGVEGLRYAVPGVDAEIRIGYRAQGKGNYSYLDWKPVDAKTDYSTIFELSSLTPGTDYEVLTEVRAPGVRQVGSTLRGTFRTLPDANKAALFKLAISTCQGFTDRDGPHGFDLYRTILNRKTDAFVMAGDVVYYDKLARSNELAYYHWQRTYSLPTLVEFHKRMPSFFLKDDHDTYVNDSWPGNDLRWTDDFKFAAGQQIFPQETGLPSPAFRTFPIGNDLQVWLMEGRDFRSPNNADDGPEKTIWGTQQKAWLKETLASSQAKFKVIISPTPIVGPDRENKSDNHANKVFATEGHEVRKLISSYPNTVTVCGDRHWQFHSVDPATGLHEFSVGPASNRHAGGWKQSDYRPDIHRFLRVAGGYLEIELAGNADDRKLILRHLDIQGNEQHRHVLD